MSYDYFVAPIPRWLTIWRKCWPVALLIFVLGGFGSSHDGYMSIARADDLSQTAKLGSQLFIFSVCEHLFSQIAARNTGETHSLVKSYERRMNEAVEHTAHALDLTYDQFKAFSVGPYMVTHGDFPRDQLDIAYAQRCYGLVK